MSGAREIHELSALELSEAYGARRLSPVEVARALLSRIDRLDGDINAFCWLDQETTLAQAREAEQRWSRSEPLGPLDGVPVGVKDLLLTRGWPTRRGSRVGDPASERSVDAPAVARLRAEGAVLMGKTTTPEHGWKAVTDSPATGVTRNPHDTRMTTGGSSGGSAAAVAAGLVPLALGTDGGGSIRIPSSFCGVVGHKPTAGLVPVWPASPFGVLSHVGPHARTAADAALLLSALAGVSSLDPASAAPVDPDLRRCTWSGARIAFSPDLGHVDVHPEIADSVAAAAHRFEELGAVVESGDPGLGDPIETFETLWFSGAARVVDLVPEHERGAMDPGLLDIAEAGRRYRAADYVAALQRRAEIAARVDRFLEDFDLVLTPTMPIAPFDAGRDVPEGWHSPRWTSWTPFTYPFNLSGNPAVSVPCGWTAQGLPIGLQLVGHRFADRAVLGAAAAIAVPDDELRQLP